MTKEAQNNKWRERQAAMLRDNLKKRKALQKAQKQGQQEQQSKETQE